MKYRQLTPTQKIKFESFAYNHKKRRIRVKYINHLFNYIDEKEIHFDDLDWLWFANRKHKENFKEWFKAM